MASQQNYATMATSFLIVVYSSRFQLLCCYCLLGSASRRPLNGTLSESAAVLLLLLSLVSRLLLLLLASPPSQSLLQLKIPSPAKPRRKGFQDGQSRPLLLASCFLLLWFDSQLSPNSIFLALSYALALAGPSPPETNSRHAIVPGSALHSNKKSRSGTKCAPFLANVV